MTEVQFILKSYSKTKESGQVTWESPSNIALVKYWGKKKGQIPENTSISFTLSNCKTITTVSFEPKSTNEFEFEVYLDGERKEDFKPKIETFFKRIEGYVPFLKDFKFKIETKNTFPHSSGIASSASGMSALALCLMSIEQLVSQVEMTDSYFNQKASFLARLGSGSACRSIEGNLVVWGNHHAIPKSSDLFGIKYPLEVHKVFHNYQDTILLVDQGEKQVSSTIGHNLMHGHPFAQDRFKQANANIEKLIPVLSSGDLETFIELMESEALSLHAMMMTSLPYFILMKPHTLAIINKIWAFRKQTGLPVGFTLDAGANVHVLYPEKEKNKILEFIQNELVAFCENEQYICDQIGFGANQIQ